MALDTERNIPVTTHGRYLVHAEPADTPRPLVAGFHGYAESAEHEMARLMNVEGSDRCIVAAIQGLHRFYRGRTNEVVASWMTSQDRLLAIEDNCAYAARVIDEVMQEWNAGPVLVLSGFSQGAAMAFRAAATLKKPVSGVVACGGDVPPELDAASLGRIPAVLIGRGLRDEWYTEEKAAADVQRLRAAGVNVEVVNYSGGHEWSPEFSTAVSRFIETLSAK